MALDDATSTFLTPMAATGAKPSHEMTPAEARERCLMLVPFPTLRRSGPSTCPPAACRRPDRRARRPAGRGRGVRPPVGLGRGPVQHHRLPGQMHGFYTMINFLPDSVAGINQVTAAIDEHLAEQPA